MAQQNDGRLHVDADLIPLWAHQYIDQLAKSDAGLRSLWVQYLDQLTKRDAAVEMRERALDGLETAYLKLEAKTRGAKWDDLKARFMELQQDDPDYRGRIADNFEICATIAALRLMRRAGGDPKFFFWIDRLQESNDETRTRTAVSFWLDRLSEDSSNIAYSQTACTIHQICQASADYCEKLSRGYMPTLHFLGLAQGEHDNKQRESPSSGNNGQSKRARDKSQLTRAVTMAYIQQPEAKGAWISQWVDEQGVPATPTMIKNGTRSYEEAWRDPGMKHSLEVVYSRIHRRMQRNGAL